LKRTILATIGALALLLFIGAPASAQDDVDDEYNDAYSYNGAYVHFSGIMSIEAFEDIDPFIVDDSEKTSGGFGARIGYRFLPWMSIEAQFVWIEEFKLEDSSFGDAKLENATSGMLNAKFYILTGRIQPYGLIGTGVTRMRLKSDLTKEKEKETMVSVQGGFGTDFYLTDGFGLNFEVVYHRQFDDLDKFSMVNANFGIFIRF
jgi:opacity protein-like surface antigen